MTIVSDIEEPNKETTTPDSKTPAAPPACEGVKGVRVTKSNAGRALDLKDPEPWPEPVELSELLHEIVRLLRRYMVLPPGAAELIALWIVHTYVIEAWDHTGYLAVVSPMRRCGKTTLLRLLLRLARRAVLADNITPAALYRVIESYGVTVIIDEVDRIDRFSPIWGIINSGHTRDGNVIRCVGDDSDPRAYETFGPKVLAYIRRSDSSVPDTVEDRTIRVGLHRRSAGGAHPQLRSKTLKSETESLRQQLVRWANDHLEQQRKAQPVIPDELDDRAADCWQPLLAVADVAGGKWPDLARELAVQFSGNRDEDDDDTLDLALLRDIRKLFDAGELKADELGLSAKSIVWQLRTLPESRWKSAPAFNGLNETSLAPLLELHGVKSRMVGPKDKRCKRYSESELRAACERFGAATPELTFTSRTPSQQK